MKAKIIGCAIWALAIAGAIILLFTTGAGSPPPPVSPALSVARYTFSFPESIGCALRYDDANPAIIHMTALMGECVKITVSGGDTNLVYRIETSVALGAPWKLLPQNLQTLPGKDTLFDLIDVPNRFYRVSAITQLPTPPAY